ncbi:unnamed protein product [Wuchereria bancrofti]|uniref:Uncharacterized protein n=1 Tax=Wuchereria bancrofti TaxID=6293 RepID=A0A3P7E0W5_WUCBA|nr:unnamed protein product [Wuchereria bancrofti]
MIIENHAVPYELLAITWSSLFGRSDTSSTLTKRENVSIYYLASELLPQYVGRKFLYLIIFKIIAGRKADMN